MASQLMERPRTRFAMRCWGDFAMADADGADARPRGRKARALLAYLAMHPDKPISRERLMALLWSDRSDEQARGSLRQTLFELKPFANGHGLVCVDRDSVMLNSEALQSDFDRFSDLAQAAQFDELIDQLPDEDECLFANLDGLSSGWDEWLLIERTRQHDRLQALISDAGESAAAAGQSRAARALRARLARTDMREFDSGNEPRLPGPLPSGAASLVATGEPTSNRRSFLKMATAVPIVTCATAAGLWWASSEGEATNTSQGEAVTLTASAKAMLRDREPASQRSAAELLRRALVLAPDYAPAWATLAIASAIGQPSPEQLADAEAQARKAIQLDPDLADGHAALGMVLGFVSDEAGAHLKRAAALSPRDPQIQYWLSHHHVGQLSFDKSLAALRASVASDPLWTRGVNEAALLAWQMGHPDEARRYAQRLLQLDPQEAFACEYQLDLANGDFAAIARRMIDSRARFDRPAQGDRKLGATLLILGHTEPARLLLRLEPYQWEIARGATPSADAFRGVDVGAMRDWFDSNYFLALALQRLLHAGRGTEIVAAHESGVGQLAQLTRSDIDRFVLVWFGPELGLALRAVGREAEARQLLGRVENIVRGAYAKGGVPIPFNVCAARLWAAQGDRERALKLITRAVDRGFHYAPVTPMPDLGKIYAFRDLRGEPRFEEARARLRSHLENERRKLGPVSI